MSLRRFLSEYDSADLAELEAAETLLGPIGAIRDEYHTALICSVLANIHRSGNHDPAQPGDFIREWGGGAADDSAEPAPDLSSKLDAWVASKRTN